MALTNQQLADKLSNVADGWQAFVDEFRNWLAGTPTGGPNSDGTYPVTSGLGVTYSLPCPSKLITILAKGDKGDQGDKGDGIVPGFGPPATEVGREGEIYIDLTNGDFYGPKTAGSWGTPHLATGLNAIYASTVAARDAAIGAASAANNALLDTDAARDDVVDRHADITSKHSTVLTKAGEVATDRATVAADKATVAADKATVITKAGEVAADKITVAADKATALQHRDDARAARDAAIEAKNDAQAAAALVDAPAINAQLGSHTTTLAGQSTALSNHATRLAALEANAWFFH